ncbi:hypothetical protein PVAND_002891 [Polypedilum vanderplanki]|uniref:Uncharacterized protein n=1 Tax=Polypedilum vanderplanki TaxID=319348 RepID=A0A9J6BU28_POLVA|nr:hypothetical protein PVAND_002891 [Polypedilum vanderplanki]
MVHDGRKLSISVDEFTSIRGRRYFGLNIHDSFNNATYNTGLVRILGSCPAEDMLIIIKNHLNDFGISLDKDIVGSTQDGAAINKNSFEFQILLDNFVSIMQYTLRNDIDDEDTFEMATDFEIIETSIDNIDHHHLLKISRKIVKFIKISPIRNQIFQSKVKSIYGKEIELHLDVKHRWNSIPTMISPLIKTKAALFETFAELNSLPIINELDFEALEILEKAMDPIRVTVLALSRQDATLLTADKALNFMISKLEQLNSDISKTLLDNLKKRIDERWNKTLMDLLNCLRDPNNIPSKEVISYAGKLANRLFYNVEADEDVVAEAEVASSEEMSLECELDLILQKNTVNVSKIDNKFKWLKQEFTLFKKYW